MKNEEWDHINQKVSTYKKMETFWKFYNGETLSMKVMLSINKKRDMTNRQLSTWTHRHVISKSWEFTKNDSTTNTSNSGMDISSP